MNKELIKKYKSEFNHWLNDGELLIRMSTGWENVNYNDVYKIQFEEKHNIGFNTAYYYKKVFPHLFEKDKHNYSDMSKYVDYVDTLRQMVADVMIGKQAIELCEFFGGNNKPETACVYVSRLYMTQEKRSLRKTVIKRHELILEKYGVEYKHLKPKFKGIKL